MLHAKEEARDRAVAKLAAKHDAERHRSPSPNAASRLSPRQVASDASAAGAHDGARRSIKCFRACEVVLKRVEDVLGSSEGVLLF